MPCLLQRRLQSRADTGIVFHDDNGSCAPRCMSGFTHFGCRLIHGRDKGKTHDELAPETDAGAVDGNRPAMQLRQLFHERQPQADARLAVTELCLLSPREWLEDLLLVLAWHTLTVVLAADDHVPVFSCP